MELKESMDQLKEWSHLYIDPENIEVLLVASDHKGDCVEWLEEYFDIRKADGSSIQRRSKL